MRLPHGCAVRYAPSGIRTRCGEYGVIEAVMRKGDGSPWHVHHEEDEWFYVLDGEFTIYVADARLTLTPGS